MVTPLAIGLIPLALKRPHLGLPLVSLHYLAFALLPFSEWRIAWESSYWALVLILV